jgi:Mrp family chromosome partitioning ATPase
MARLIQALGQQFDNVIIDGPPVMGFADAPLIAAVTEATVMVVESGKTARSIAVNAVNRLEATGGVTLGSILNKYDRKVNGFSYSGYGYYDYDYSGAKPKRELIAPPTAPDADEPRAA